MKIMVADIGNKRSKLVYGQSDRSFSKESWQVLLHEQLQLTDPGNATASQDRSQQIHPSGSGKTSTADSFFENLVEYDPQYCLYSSVNTSASNLFLEQCRERIPNLKFEALAEFNSPIELNVDFPHQLGTDRIAAAYGAYLRTGQSTIIVDSGTAVTIDLIDNQGGFQGGVIFPGMELCHNALVNGAENLEPIQFDNDSVGILGRNTKTAIESGVFWSHVGAMEKIVTNLQRESGAIPVLATGGNGRKLLQSAIELEYHSHLVLEGLWAVAIQRCLS